MGFRFSVIVPLQAECRPVVFTLSDSTTDTDVATGPGGGEPSAVKSDFCSVRVFATGSGRAVTLFMWVTCVVT